MPSPRAALTISCVLLLACGGGGGGGPSGPSDRTPPAQPDASRVQTSIASGIATVTGSAGAVEVSSRVRARNAASEQSAETSADGGGAFSLTIAAGFGDRIELTAADAAGNRSPSLDLTAGLLDVGQTLSIPFSSGSAQFGLVFPSGSEEHLMVLESAAPTAGLVNTIFTTTTHPQAALKPRPGTRLAPNPQAVAEARRWQRFQEFLRANPRPALARARPLTLHGEPTVGQVEPFFVGDEDGNAMQVPATLRHISAHALVYVDQRILPSELSDAQVRAAGMVFDPAIYDRDRSLFGTETDVDGNGRIKILFTPGVNFVGVGVLGFFFPGDLVSRDVFEFSNETEVFYVLSPDPTGRFGWQTPTMDVLLLDIIPTILAHEFQHMIAIGARLFGGLAIRDVWLEESWAHVAEWLNGHRAVDEFRTAAFTDLPEAYPLIGTQESDGERGASFLIGMYLLDEVGGGVLRASIQDPGTGQDNVESITGRAWPDVFHDWALALALDGSAASSAHDFANLDPREIHSRLKTEAPDLFLNDYLFAVLFDVSEISGTLAQAGTTPSYLRIESSESRTVADIQAGGPIGAGLRIGIARTR